MITVEDARDFLSMMGISYRDVGDRFSLSCPLGIHTDSDPSFSIYKDTDVGQPVCVCFSCGFSGSLNSLSRQLTGETIYSILGKPNERANQEFAASLRKPTPKREFGSKIKEAVLEEGTLEPVYTYQHVMEYLRKRGLDHATIEHFQIKYLRYGKINGALYYDRVTIPILEGDRVLSYELRDPTEDPEKKKVLYPKGGSVSTLFNYNHLERNKPLIVVEGIMDTWKVWRYITKNVTCTFGIMINKVQQSLLSQFKYIILMPDGDDGGGRFISNLYDFYDTEFYVARIPEGRDPGDCTKTELLMAISKRISSSELMLERYGLLNKKQAYRWDT